MSDFTPQVHTNVVAYPHQVGGHGQLAMTKSGHVLKPLLEKEKRFYQYIHSDGLPPNMRWIRLVTPKFYGEADYPRANDDNKINNTTNDDNNNNGNNNNNNTTTHTSTITFTTDNNNNTDNNNDTTTIPITNTTTITTTTITTTDNNKNVNNKNNHNNNDNDNCINVNTASQSSTTKTITTNTTISSNHDSVPQWRSSHGEELLPVNISPWAAQMRLRMHGIGGTSNKKKKGPSRSIALEDVNRKFEIPCVLDCKVGIRHYDDDATPEKKRRHIEKANRTTTAKCGVRYTGMQSFKRSSHSSCEGMFETANKYDGRKLKEHDLIPEATWFFHDGFNVRIECITMILERLVKLRHCILHQHHFFFYSSSLLLVYEGASQDMAPPRVEVRMIDFAHTVLSNGQRDDGYLKGLNYLIHILSQILINEQCDQHILPKRAEQRPSSSSSNQPTTET